MKVKENGIIDGLNAHEVEARSHAHPNQQTHQSGSKTYVEIVKDNVMTLFNALNFMIFLALIMVSAWSNLVFMGIIIMNIAIGIRQEVKAKHLVDHLSILTAPSIKVMRDGEEKCLDIQDVVRDDVLVLRSGDQVCNDAVLISGQVEVNESLLTGETDPIEKTTGEELLSGSSIIAGKCYAKVLNVGQENYATQLVQKAQAAKKQYSELHKAMNQVTRVTTLVLIPIAVVLFIESFWLRENTMTMTVVAVSAGLLGMLPKGLVLLTSISLANGVAHLAERHVLVQDLYSLETLAHVDVLCLDKTGTITDGHMKVETCFTYETIKTLLPKDIMGAYLAASDDHNVTFDAMTDYFEKKHMLQPSRKIPFSSLRKWSAIEFSNFGTIVVGAVDKLFAQDSWVDIQPYLENGKRAIAVGFTEERIDKAETLPPLKMVMILILSDTMRKETRETLDYFYQEGIDVKVISGDHIQTVTAIAKEAGIRHYEQAIDMTPVLDEDLSEVVSMHTVFGRVTPYQKQRIVEELQNLNHKVAMTGDGVNDLLALKTADCSIALADGSDASKQLAQVVLLNNDFTSLPGILLEGRQVVNNVTRVAGVFFIKTVYTVLLSLFCILMNVPFPFIPLQITLIDLFIEAIPSFLTLFEADTSKVHGAFLPKVFAKAAPYAIGVTVSFILIILFYSGFYFQYNEAITIAYFVLGVLSMIAVVHSCIPMTYIRIFACLVMMVGFLSTLFLMPELISLSVMTPRMLRYGLILCIMAFVIERSCAFLICHYGKKTVNITTKELV